jgi:hypothetical protein
MMQNLFIQPKILPFRDNGVHEPFLYMMVKCLVGCMFWRNIRVAYNSFNIKTVDLHGSSESVRFHGTIMRKLSSHSNLCGSQQSVSFFNPLNTKLNPICHLLALVGVHHILHVSNVRVNHVQSPCYFSNSELMAVFSPF